MKKFAWTILSAISLISLQLDAAQLQLEKVIIENFGKGHPLYLSSEEVATLKSKTNLTTEELLQGLVPLAATYARPDISGYHVGSAALGKSGAIYFGCNIELPGQPLNQAIHSEQFAIANAKNHNERELVAIAISAAPCGHCRQFMNEMRDAQNFQILVANTAQQTLSQLLPQSFGPSDLGLSGGLLDAPAKDKAFTMDYSLKTLGHIAAWNSYAPYTKCKSGVALQTPEGRIYSGSYLENVAFNPSLSPLQVALVALISDNRTYDEIVDVLLTEQEKGAISQEATTRAILKTIAPSARFHVRHIDLTK